MRTLAFPLVVALQLTPVFAGRAQSVLGGTVRDAGTHALLADVEVVIAELKLASRTDGRGRFRVDDINGGRYRVVVWKVGYDSTSLIVPFSGEDSVTRDFTLATHGQPLPMVPIVEKTDDRTNSKLAEFEERRHGGVGHFVTPSELEKEQEKPLSDVIQKLPGAVIARARGGSRGTASGSAAFVLSSRGQATLTNAGSFGLSCPVAVWLDGVPVYRGNDKISSSKGELGQRVPLPGQGAEPPFDVNQINTKTVAAIEFYAGPAQLPARFNITQGTCGALVIWTK